MALSAGEIEAVLKLRDEMTPAMAQAAKSVSTYTKDMVAGMSSIGGPAATAAAASQRMIAGMSQAATVGTGFAGMLGKAGPLLGAFGATMGAAAAVGFARSLMTNADALVKMHDKTAISIGGLQEMQRVGGLTGVAMESMAASVNILQRTIANGGDDARQAIKDLGLNFDEIRRMKPEDQYFAIAKALGGVADQNELVAIGTKLMGRGFAETLPAIKEGFGDVTHSMEGSIRTLEHMGDVLAEVWRVAKNVGTVGLATAFDAVVGPIEDTIGRLGLLKGVLTGNLGATDALAQAQKGLAGHLPRVAAAARDLTVTEEEQARIEKRLAGVLGDQKDARNEAEKAREKADRAEAKALEEAIELWDHKQAGQAAAYAWYPKLDTAALHYDGTIGLLDTTVRGLGKIGPQVFDEITTSVSLSNEEIRRMREEAAAAGRTLKDSLASLKAGDIGQVFKDIGKFFREGVSDIGTGFLEQIGGNLLNTLSGLAMKGLKALGSAIMNIGGPSKEQLAARQEQEKFAEALRNSATQQQLLTLAGVRGGQTYATFAIIGRDAMLAVGRSAAEADLVVKGLLDTDNPAAFAAAMGQVQAALDLTKQANETLTETLGRYKFTIEELGPALANQKLSEQARQLFTDWQVLTSAGINIAAVGREMQGSINAFWQDSVRAGQEIDVAMRPMLEQMLKMGLLTDDAGNTISSLEEAGIEFSMTMSEGFRQLIDQVKILTDTIARGLGFAIENVPPVVLPVSYDYGGGPQLPPGLPFHEMAEGGAGRVTRPTLFLAGEAGSEDFAFSGGGSRFGGGGGTSITINAQNSFFDTPASLDRLADLVSDAAMRKQRRRERLS